MLDRAFFIKRLLVRVGIVLTAILLAVAAATAQQTEQGRSLTLEEAIRVASEQSEQVTMARAGVQRARGEQYQARSEYYPQILAALSYTRTLKTEFSAVSEDTTSTESESCADFTPNRMLPLSERVDSLEAALGCRDQENPFGSLFSNLPFGRANQWNAGLSLSQIVYSGGRVQALSRMAGANRHSAEITLASAHAQLVLDVTAAYYNAVLSTQLLAIAEATMSQAETTLGHVRLARQVGEQPEFELLRATVTRDNQRPIVIQRRADRDIAHMRLKQMLNYPLDQPLNLTTALAQTELPPVAAMAVESDTSAEARAPVRQADQAVRVQESLRTVAKSQRLPSVIVTSQYGRVGYPIGGVPQWSQFRTNWTVTAGAQMPIFTGGRIKGDVMIADANLIDARARLQQTRELAALDTRNAIEQLRAAEASWRASAGTVEQAVRAYSIADIRFKEGISTQTELNDSRILLQQAQANRAIAARDLQVARARVTLLPDLPLGTSIGTGFIPPVDPGFVSPQPLTPTAPAVPQSQRGAPVPVQASRVRN